MTQTLSVGTAVLVVMGALGSTPQATAADVKLGGYTHAWLGADQYKPLRSVTVTVLRNGSFVDSATSELNTRQEAEFTLRIRAGEPIQVIFYLSKDYMPEMQSLSAVPGLEHHVSAALMTVDQYQELQSRNRSMVPVKEKLRCIARMVPEGHRLYRELHEMILGVERKQNR